MTPTQAIAVRALWQTLGENGNLLALSWSKLLADVSPTDLIKVAERLSTKLPKLYTDTIELIRTTGAVLEAEGDRLEDLGAVPSSGPRPKGDPILDELLTIERENGKSELRARQAWHEATGGDPWPDDLEEEPDAD